MPRKNKPNTNKHYTYTFTTLSMLLCQVISEEEKQKYQKLAEEDRERYRREIMGNYGKGPSKDGSRRGRRKKEPGQPKRNM